MDAYLVFHTRQGSPEKYTFNRLLNKRTFLITLNRFVTFKPVYSANKNINLIKMRRNAFAKSTHYKYFRTA